MDMDLDKLLKEFGTASLLVAISFFLTVQAIGAYLYHVNSWDLKLSLLLGTILGCTSAAIVIPVVSRLNIREEVKTIVFVESALSDVLAIVMTISIIELVSFGSVGINAPFKAVASSFSTAIVMGGAERAPLAQDPRSVPRAEVFLHGDPGGRAHHLRAGAVLRRQRSHRRAGVRPDPGQQP
jgi:NhaP-type Na+/H+ and K+/H+ antiporter